jgi:hypothetical protein
MKFIPNVRLRCVNLVTNSQPQCAKAPVCQSPIIAESIITEAETVLAQSTPHIAEWRRE